MLLCHNESIEGLDIKLYADRSMDCRLPIIIVDELFYPFNVVGNVKASIITPLKFNEKKIETKAFTDTGIEYIFGSMAIVTSQNPDDVRNSIVFNNGNTKIWEIKNHVNVKRVK